MKEELLTIGSVVVLKKSEKQLMIIGYRPITENNKTYDYEGCLFPEGFIMDNHILFNNSDIEKVEHYGYSNEEDRKLKEKIINHINNKINKNGE